MKRRDLIISTAVAALGQFAYSHVAKGVALAKDEKKGDWKFRWGDGPPYPAFVKGGAMAVVSDAVAYVAGSTYPWRETEMGWYFEPEKDWKAPESGSLQQEDKKALLSSGWKPLPPMPVGRAYTHGTGVLDSLVVVGGRWQRHACKEVFRLYRRSSKEWQWEVLPSLSQARAVAGVAAVGSMVIAVGGGDWDRIRGGAFMTREVTLVEGLDLQQKDKGWRSLASFPGGHRVGTMTASAKGKVYVFGGYDSWYENDQRRLQEHTDAFCYDVESNRWEAIPSLPAALRNAAVTTLDDRHIVMAGGVAEIPDGSQQNYQSILVDPKRRVVLGQYSNRVLVYDTVNRAYTWAEGRMPRGHGDMRMCQLGSRLYALGGENVDVTLSNCTNDFMVGERVS